MKAPGVTSTALVLLIGSILLCARANPVLHGLYFVPFAFGPLVVSLGLALVWRARRQAQWTLAVASALYLAAFGYVYCDVFYLHPDALGAIALLFIGLYALPAMLVAWLIAWRWGRPKPASKP